MPLTATAEALVACPGRCVPWLAWLSKECWVVLYAGSRQLPELPEAPALHVNWWISCECSALEQAAW